MIDNGHIDIAKAVGDALQPAKIFDSTDLDDPIAMLKFYKDTYPSVELVTCKKCKLPLCLWVLDEKQTQDNMRMHPNGYRRITIGDSLLSTRSRLDGEVGYKCKCGNDSILASSEFGIVPQLKYSKEGELLNPGIGLDLQPHHIAVYEQSAADSGYTPKRKQLSVKKFQLDNFITEKIK